MKTHKQNHNEQGGFIRTIIILVVLLVILSLLGFNVDKIWTQVIAPIFIFIGNIILGISNWLVSLLRDGRDAVSTLI